MDKSLLAKLQVCAVTRPPIVEGPSMLSTRGRSRPKPAANHELTRFTGILAPLSTGAYNPATVRLPVWFCRVAAARASNRGSLNFDAR